MCLSRNAQAMGIPPPVHVLFEDWSAYYPPDPTYRPMWAELQQKKFVPDGDGASLARAFLSGHVFSVFSPVEKRRPPTAVGYPASAVGSPPTVVGRPPTAVGCLSSAVQLCAQILSWLLDGPSFLFKFQLNTNVLCLVEFSQICTQRNGVPRVFAGRFCRSHGRRKIAVLVP